MQELTKAVRATTQVSGYTHCFYRYPARFSPLFVRKAIELFTEPGDLVLDPFMGGGTTMVEARTSGRIGLGIDINELAVFIAQSKTTLVYSTDILAIRKWVSKSKDYITLFSEGGSVPTDLSEPYLRHMRNSDTWRLRRLIQNSLYSLRLLPRKRQQDFVRCAILSTGQWALDGRINIPSAGQFRIYLQKRIEDMINGASKFAWAARKSDKLTVVKGLRRTLCLKKSATDLHNSKLIGSYPAPRLIITSPPYPGVHVLYHRWQIQSRRETAFPYWIANCQDGTGSSHYTFGDRNQPGLTKYFEVARESFTSIRKLCDKNTTVIQLVAFSNPSWQIPQYLDAMSSSGFSLIGKPFDPNDSNPLIQRTVPNRKWYAATKGNTPASNEFLMIHRPLRRI